MALTKERFQITRNVLNLSLYEIAKEVGISDSLLSRIEKGERNISAKVEKGINAAFLKQLNGDKNKLHQLYEIADEAVQIAS